MDATQGQSTSKHRFDPPIPVPPRRDISAPAGYTAPIGVQSSDAIEDPAALVQVVEEVLQDTLALRHLSDRVYELMQDDLYLQQERGRGYGRRF